MINQVHIDQVFRMIDNSRQTLNDMCKDAKFEPEIAGLVISVSRFARHFFPGFTPLGVDWKNATEFAKTARSFCGLNGSISFVTGLRKAKNGEYVWESGNKFFISAFKGIKYGRSFVYDLHKMNIIHIPKIAGCLEKLAFKAKMLGIAATTMELYNAVRGFADAWAMSAILHDEGHEFEHINLGLSEDELPNLDESVTDDPNNILGDKTADKKETLKKCCHTLMRDSLITIVKSVCSIVVSFFGSVSIILFGAVIEDYIDPVEIIFDLGANVLSFGKHYVGHYDHNDETYENEEVKTAQINMTKSFIKKEFYTRTA